MRHKTRPKSMKRKYKRLVAAMAGAAVMSSALLPGIPVAQAAHAPEGSDTDGKSAPVTAVDRASVRGNPVEVVRDNASRFGFSASDSFSLESKSGSKATVRVRSGGQTYKVDLNAKGGEWVITTIRGIGDMNRPATYVPASFFPGAAATTAVTATLGASQYIIQQTDKYAGWQWYEGSYPRDMSIGVYLKDPRPNGQPVPADNVLSAVNGVDFFRQFVLHAHLGSVAAKGYGIGIAKVAQTGNDLTVTVRTKSPLAGETLANTKGDDFVTIDRTNLDFTKSIHITFVDQNGTVLIRYTITPG